MDIGMDIGKIRNQFAVFIVGGNFQSAQSMAETVKTSGYEDSPFYPTLESALAMARQSPPHMILLDFGAFENSAQAFLVEIKAISSEVLVILTLDSKQALTGLQLVSRGLAYDTILSPLISSLEIVQALDRAAERLFYQFESEQLREESGEENGKEPLRARAHSQTAVGGVPLQDLFAKLAAVKELDQTVHVFMEGLGRVLGPVPVVYLKYMPSHMSLLASHATFLSMDKIRGIGIDFKREEPHRLAELFQRPRESEPVRSLVRQVFLSDRFTAFAHMNESELLGLFVALDDVDFESATSEAQYLRQFFELAYKRNLVLKEKHLLDVADSLTGLANRRSFTQKLDEEISRSRRLYLPVSMISIGLDGVQRLQERLGAQQTDSILKTIAMILKRTARANDVLARTGSHEFVCLLPHTGQAGATAKAERVRRIIESTKIPLLEQTGLGSITVSCGVSEYPSFANDAESLMRTSDEALQQVKRLGGNKVCLATPPQGFQLDFVPLDLHKQGPTLDIEEAW